jgi:hypothetical protein
LAYEYAGDIGDFLGKLETEYKIPPILPEAMALQYLSGPGTSQAKRAADRGAEQAGMALERGMEPVVRGALEQGGLPREMALAMGANTQSNVIKPKNGNWFGTSVPDAMSIYKRNTAAGNNPADILQQMQERYTPEVLANMQEGSRANILEQTDTLEKMAALNKWVDSNLTNYVKKQMATPEDPIRKLAEEGIIHIPTEEVGINRYRAPRHRELYEGEQLGQSEAAKAWEDASDVAINAPKVEILQAKNFLDRNPWIKDLPMEQRVYALNSPASSSQEISGLGFDHIMDVLRQDLVSGRIRPEQLNKVSMEQAVRRTYEYDQEMAKEMRRVALERQEGFPVQKEYPEGYKWIELTKPKYEVLEENLPAGYSLRKSDDAYENQKWQVVDEKGLPAAEYVRANFNSKVGDPKLKALENFFDKKSNKQLKDALDYEGKAMGHCVGSYCDEVSEGNKKIYTLRDKKGEPHVTIEVVPSDDAQAFYEANKKWLDQPVIRRELDLMQDPDLDIPLSEQYVTAARKLLTESGIQFNEPTPIPPVIKQIKGKQNRAPKDEYLPYVQDFVRSGNWTDVRDLSNTGLLQPYEVIGSEALKALKAKGIQIPKYMTKEEADELGKQAIRASDIPTLDEAAKLLPPEGMKAGGKVSISKNPDTMMLELNNQKMKNGEPAYGAGKLVTSKAAKVPPPIRFPVTRGPSIPEIRAMAERMAPQVMGEFVREAPTASKPNPSANVVGKSKKQFDREKNLQIGYQDIKTPVTPQEFDYAKHKDDLLIGAAGDVTPANRMLLSIDNQPLSYAVHQQGGPEWALYNPSGWAASDEMARTYMKRADMAAEAYDAEPLLHYHKMTPDANWYAMHHLHSLLGHMRPEELRFKNPELYSKMVDEIRNKDVGFGKHPEFEGFDDPLNLNIHAQIDPHFRRHLGAILGSPTFAERYGLNSGVDVMAATSLPELRDLEVGSSGYAIVPLDTKAPLQHFAADSQTYDTGFPMKGEPMRSKYPSPYQLIYRDTLNWMKEHPSEKKSSEFGRMNMIVPKQQIDNELIEAIGEYQRRMKELTGKKKGGAIKKPIKKAEGGAITGDDLIIEERPL